MRQTIKVNLRYQSSGNSLKILSIHEVNQQIIVVCRFFLGPMSFFIPSISSPEQIVKTSSEQPLPVKYYLQNNSRDFEYNNKFTDNPDYTPFTFITDLKDIPEPLTQDSCLYEYKPPVQLSDAEIEKRKQFNLNFMRELVGQSIQASAPLPEPCTAKAKRASTARQAIPGFYDERSSKRVSRRIEDEEENLIQTLKTPQ